MTKIRRVGSIAIRPAALADIMSVRGLLIDTWHATYDGWLGAERVREISETWHAEAQLAAQVGQPDSVFLVAEVDGNLAGTAFAHATGDGVEIGRLYVRPSFQGQGAGSALLSAALEAFPYESLFYLDVEPRNAGAIAFYHRHGFAIIGGGTADGAAGSGIPHLRLEISRSQRLTR